MESVSELVGNPITLLIERVVYLAIGVFFLVAFFTGIQRNNQNEE